MNAPHEPTPAGGMHQPPPGAAAMNVVRVLLLAGLVVLAVASVAGYVIVKRARHAGASAEAATLWTCPMHPSVTSHQPGECAICGMKLVPVERRAAEPPAAGGVPGLTTVEITPERIQRIGVRTARVERGSLGDALDLVGFVTPDETRLRRVQLRVPGWIRELYVNQTGESVRRDQPLLAIYSPELYASEQEYLIARGGGGAGMAGMTASDATSAGAERLRLQGVPEEEIHRLDHEGTAAKQVVLRAPVSGTVLERGAVAGQYVGADTPLLTLADLSRVWVLADLYEMDAARVKVGDAARLVVDAYPGREFTGRIEFVYPTVSDQTRTLKARLSLANPDGVLRPGMYGRVRVAAPGRPALTVPDEAVIRTGDHAYVFLAHAGGRFEPREVFPGTSAGERVTILRGVAEGDTVVASASFLIDSESRLQAAIAGMGAAVGSTGMDAGQGRTP